MCTKQLLGTDTLVPLTGSLYVNGKLGATDKVLIDIGTGYFLEVRVNNELYINAMNIVCIHDQLAFHF